MKLRNIIIASLAVLTLASCEDMIVRKSLVQPSADTFFTNATEISGGVNACYAQVNLFVGGYGDFPTLSGRTPMSESVDAIL